MASVGLVLHLLDEDGILYEEATLPVELLSNAQRLNTVQKELYT